MIESIFQNNYFCTDFVIQRSSGFIGQDGIFHVSYTSIPASGVVQPVVDFAKNRLSFQKDGEHTLSTIQIYTQHELCIGNEYMQISDNILWQENLYQLRSLKNWFHDGSDGFFFVAVAEKNFSSNFSLKKK